MTQMLRKLSADTDRIRRFNWWSEILSIGDMYHVITFPPISEKFQVSKKTS